MSKQKQSLAPLISTIIVAVLAIGLAVAAILIMTGDNDNNNSEAQNSGASVSDTSFKPTQELISECTYAAHDLVAASYRVVRLFVTQGLDHLDEPYGNRPEDGLYTVSSTEFTSLEQIQALVKSVYTPEEALRILTDVDGNGLAVYQNREKLVKVEKPLPGTSEATAEAEAEDTSDGSVQYKTEYVLGISEKFKPAENYTKDWSSCRIAVTPLSETECKLVVYLDGLDPETVTDADKDSILEMSMIKNGEDWRLTAFRY